MNPADVPEKTEAGAREIRERTLRLAPRLRSMLIVVDGQRTVSELTAAAAQAGAPADFLDTLLAQGLVQIRPVPPPRVRSAQATAAKPADTSRPPAEAGDRLRAAQKQMTDAVVDALGVRALFFTLKVERCFSLPDLDALVPEFRRLIAKAKDEATADRAVAHVREMLQ